MASINEQHKQELENREVSINLMRRELQQYQHSPQARDREILELKAMIEQLVGQVKGKGKALDATLEASRVVGRNTPPPA